MQQRYSASSSAHSWTENQLKTPLTRSCVFNPLKSRMVRDTHICKLTLINSVIIKLNMMMMMMTSMIKFAMCYICLHDADTMMTIQNTQKVEWRRLWALMGHTKHRFKLRSSLLLSGIKKSLRSFETFPCFDLPFRNMPVNFVFDQ